MTAVSPLAPEHFPKLAPIAGVRLATFACGIRYTGRDDLMLAELAPASAVAGVFTRSLTAGALPDTPTPGTVGGSGSIIFPQFASGGGWATEVSLINAGTTAVTGRIDFFNPDGSPAPLTLNGSLKSTFTYSIPAGATLILAPRDSNGQSPL